MLRKEKVKTEELATALLKVEADKQLSEMHKAKVEANRLDTFELNETSGPWVTKMTQDQAIIIRTWISTFEANHTARQYKVQDYGVFKQEEKEHTNIEKAMHRRCQDAMTDGLQGKIKEKPSKENKFDIAEKGRFGWVPYGDIFHWCKQQHMQETKEEEGWTEEMFWNMILHTQHFVTNKFFYNVKCWPNIGMIMIKVAMEDEEETENEAKKEQEYGRKRQWAPQSSQQEKPSSSRGWTTPKKTGWAAKGYENLLKEDSDEDVGKGQDSWTGRKYGKGTGGRRN